MYLKRYFFFPLILITSLACNNAVKKEHKKIFRYNQIGGLETLDPAFAKNLSIMWGVHCIFNTLIEVDTQLNLQPSLATKWTVSDDQLTYIFNIRNDVYFQDNAIFLNGKGRKMTAHDIAYSFNRLIDPATASSGAWIFNDRVNKEKPFIAINDTLFQIKLNKPFQPILYLLTMPYCAIIPNEGITKWGKDFRNHPVGTGPFAFQLWDENNILVLKKNEHYWEKDEQGKSLPYLDGVQVSFNETRAMEFLLFQQGKLDFINGIDGSVKDLVLNKKGALKEAFTSKMQLQKAVYLNTEYLGINVDNNNSVLKNQPLLHKQIRQAIQLAIDKQKIVTFYRNGVGIPAYGFIPKGLPGSNFGNTDNNYNYNPSKALSLLAEAGFPNGKGLAPIELYTPESQVDICNFIVSQLQDIGITAKVQVMQPGILRQLMSKEEVAFFKAQWIADFPDAESFLSFFYSTLPAPPNYTRFKNATFDHWYEQSIAAKEDSIKTILYQKMDSLIMEESPVIPLFYDEILHFVQNNIEGMQRNSMNIIELKKVIKH